MWEGSFPFENDKVLIKCFPPSLSKCVSDRSRRVHNDGDDVANDAREGRRRCAGKIEFSRIGWNPDLATIESQNG